MNWQNRADIRSKSLHKEIIKKLREDPGLWEIPIKNLKKWKVMKGGLTPALLEWEDILKSYAKEQIISMLESDSGESTRLRSSSPFAGILTETERRKIFNRYRDKTKKLRLES